MTQLTTRFNENSDVSFFDLVKKDDRVLVQKTLRVPLSNYQDAQKYIIDAEYYVQQLKDDGYLVPDIYDYDIDEQYRVKQYSEHIQGDDLRRSPDVRSMQKVLATMGQASISFSGQYHVPIDSKTANFVKNAVGQVFLVDTLPPLIQKHTNSFPYSRILSRENRITKNWADRYVREQEGSMVRFLSLSIAGLSSYRTLCCASLPSARNDLLESLLGDVPDNLIDGVRKKVMPFLVGTVLRRCSEKFN